MTNRNACSRKSIIILAAVVVLAGFRPGLAEDQETKKLRQTAELGDASAFKLKDELRPMMSTEQVAGAQELSATLWERIESSKSE